MSNRIDFFQSAETDFALPATTVSILLEGVLCPCLEPIGIVHCGWPEFGWARLAYNPAAQTEGCLRSVEDIETELAMGKSICIQQVYNGLAPGAGTFSFPVFEGQIERVETVLGNVGERVEIVAKDFSANLKRVSVYGRRFAKPDSSSVFLSGLDTEFNPDGRPNAAAESISNNGNTYTVFCAEPSQSRFWGYAEVIDYLLCEYLPKGQLQTPGIKRLRVLTGNRKVRNLDVTGLNLLEALHRCCDKIGVRFKFVPRPVPIGPRQAIVFYKSGAGKAVELNYQPTGERFSISKTNISVLHSEKNFFPVTHRYIGRGDFKVYEATFELVKGWDPADENADYGKFSPSTNPDFNKVKDVYRKWVLNEAGDYSGEPYSRGDAFDFSKVFSSSNFTHCRRRFLPALTTDKQGKSLGYFLQVSFDNGQHWWQYLYAFTSLPGECGVWLSSNQLDFDTWVAAQAGVLRFRITASVISDERLTCEIADGPVDSVVPVVERVITLPREFEYRKVSGESVFAGHCGEELGEPDEVDDGDALYGFVREMAQESSEVIDRIDVQTPCLVLDYQVGDRIAASPESRDLLSVRSDNRSTSWIERVQMDFEKQCTNLKIVRQRR